MNKRHEKTKRMVRFAVLVAILLVMELTNIGYIKMPTGLELTIMQIPVLVGAIIMGPAAGAALGGVFGLTSLWQCIVGKSAFGEVLFGINPFYAIILCIVPRVLMGWLCGLIFKAMHKPGKKNEIVPFAVASLAGALLNTLFFMSALVLLFGNTDYIMSFRGDLNVFAFIAAFVGVQGLIEAGICFLGGTAISKALFRFVTVEDEKNI